MKKANPFEPTRVERARMKAEHERRTEADTSASVVTFLEFQFTDKYPPSPRALGQAARFLPARLKDALKVQADLRAVLGPALDALADSELSDSPVEKLTDLFANLKGEPYRFERKLDGGKEGREWVRHPGVKVYSLTDYILAALAILFDGGKMNLLGHCRLCGKFFMSKGQGRPPKYCPEHSGNVAGNEMRKRSGYFKKKYRKQVADKVGRAKRLSHGRTVWGNAWIKKTGLGKELLKRYGLWEEADTDHWTGSGRGTAFTDVLNQKKEVGMKKKKPKRGGRYGKGK